MGNEFAIQVLRVCVRVCVWRDSSYDTLLNNDQECYPVEKKVSRNSVIQNQ